jgi:hypothetical protein
VRAVLVVEEPEAVEMGAELGERSRGGCFASPALLGLMEPLDLAAGLQVVRRRMLADDAQPLELGFVLPGPHEFARAWAGCRHTIGPTQSKGTHDGYPAARGQRSKLEISAELRQRQ